MIKSNEKKVHLPCNCYHSYEDHKNLGNIETYEHGILVEDRPAISWCIWSETGQCPCDIYSSMTNLEYLEYLYNKKDL